VSHSQSFAPAPEMLVSRGAVGAPDAEIYLKEGVLFLDGNGTGWRSWSVWRPDRLESPTVLRDRFTPDLAIILIQGTYECPPPHGVSRLKASIGQSTAFHSSRLPGRRCSYPAGRSSRGDNASGAGCCWARSSSRWASGS